MTTPPSPELNYLTMSAALTGLLWVPIIVNRLRGEQFAGRADDAFVGPDAIAATALHLARQHRSAWSFEVDVRPFNEKW